MKLQLDPITVSKTNTTLDIPQPLFRQGQCVVIEPTGLVKGETPTVLRIAKIVMTGGWKVEDDDDNRYLTVDRHQLTYRAVVQFSAMVPEAVIPGTAWDYDASTLESVATPVDWNFPIVESTPSEEMIARKAAWDAAFQSDDPVQSFHTYLFGDLPLGRAGKLCQRLQAEMGKCEESFSLDENAPDDETLKQVIAYLNSDTWTVAHIDNSNDMSCYANRWAVPHWRFTKTSTTQE